MERASAFKTQHFALNRTVFAVKLTVLGLKRTVFSPKFANRRPYRPLTIHIRVRFSVMPLMMLRSVGHVGILVVRFA
jgi:hypothetical protein